MRSALYHNNPLVEWNGDERNLETASWQDYRPVTNVLWLQFVLTALRKAVSTSSAEQEGSSPETSGKSTNSRELHRLYEKRLTAVENWLDPAKLGDASQWSAMAVVDYALKRKWLNEDDVNDYDLDGED